MIKRKKIDLSAKPVFDQYLQNQDNSTYNFTNMYLWAGDDKITYCETDGCLALFFLWGKQPLSASYPVGDGDKRAAVRSLSAYLCEQGICPVFRNLSASMAEELQDMFPDCFKFTADRDAADYIYETDKLIHLSGKKLHGKRNHLNYFKNTYAYEYKTLKESDMADCLALFDKWFDEKESMKLLSSSREATVKLLSGFGQLPVRGGGIYVDGEMVAFSIGEPVSQDTALIHVEFAADIRGAFNVINQEFCAREWADYLYVNREEDMGLPGLRQAKLAYRPVRLLEKFNAVQVKPL
ncbi:MAG: DUF2156 domain-containing protein [Clostridia bacterium]|nr:DUF2156 domain-containing protein [Clostridia bacterium]